MKKNTNFKENDFEDDSDASTEDAGNEIEKPMKAKAVANIIAKVPEDMVNHPKHYGGKDNPYEVIKVIDAWKLNFNLGNAVKYIARAEYKGDVLEDLKKASWYLQHEIEKLEADIDV